MARDKVSKAAAHRTHLPIGLQDDTGLLETIIEALNVTIIEPLEVRLQTVEGELAALLEALLASGQVLRSVDVELLPRTLSGHIDVEGLFTEAQIGAPVLLAQGAPVDELEGVLTLAGEVRDTRTLRIVWQSSALPPLKVRINYIVGTLEE